MSMYNLYREVYPPSCVEDAIPCHFTSPTARNLVVVKASTLEIYEVLEVADEEEKKFWIGKDSKDQEKKNDQIYPKIRASLEMIATYKIHGNISSINCIRTTTSVGLLGMDSLLLSFKDAKMSLLEWSNATKEIITVSLHYYEREEFQDIYLSATNPEIRVDPLNRCAALKFYFDQIAILPFKQEVAGGVASTYMEEEFHKGNSDRDTRENPCLSSFVISGKQISKKIKNIIDIVFLYNYFEPTLAILYQTDLTWPGRLAQKNDTCSLCVVSLDLTQHIYPVLFSVDNLPYNCFKLISVPSPVGGILVVSQNGLVYIDQTAVPGISLGLNEYFGLEKELSTRGDDSNASLLQKSMALQPKNPLYSSRMTNFKYLGVTLDASVSCFLNPDTLLFILKEGDVLIVEMVANEGDGHGWSRKKNGMSKFRVAKCGIKTTPPICICKVGQELNSDGVDRWKNENKGTGYLFVGSRVDDSMLLQYQEFEILDILEEENEEGASAKATSSAKDSNANELIDDLYNISATPSTKPSTTTTETATTTTTTEAKTTSAETTTTTTTAKNKENEDDSSSENDFYNINIPFDPNMDIISNNEKEKKDTSMKLDDDSLDDELYALTEEQTETNDADTQKKTEDAEEEDIVRYIPPSSKFFFRVLDVLNNIGPITQMEISDPGWASACPYADFDDFPHNYQPTIPRKDIQIVTCSGGQDPSRGSLNVLRKNIHPVIYGNFEELGDDIQNVWAIKLKLLSSLYLDLSTSSNNTKEKLYDRILVISKESNTMVLETGEELSELEESGFYEDGPTVGVASFLKNSIVIQVYQKGILVINGDYKKIDEVTIDSERCIVHCSLIDPYILVLLDNGNTCIYKIDEKELKIERIKDMERTDVKTCCLYKSPLSVFPYCDDANKILSKFYIKGKKLQTFIKDKNNKKRNMSSSDHNNEKKMKIDSDSALYNADDLYDDAPGLYGEDESETTKAATTTVESEKVKQNTDNDVSMDDIDLYGVADPMDSETKKDKDDDKKESEPSKDTSKDKEEGKKEEKPAEAKPEDSMSIDEEEKTVKSNQHEIDYSRNEKYWCVIYTKKGSLEIYSLDDFQSHFVYNRLDYLPKLVMDQYHMKMNKLDENIESQDISTDIEEILLTNFKKDSKNLYPYLIIRTSLNDLIIYKSFLFSTSFEYNSSIGLIRNNSFNSENSSSSNTENTRLGIRFKRIEHDFLTREPNQNINDNPFLNTNKKKESKKSSTENEDKMNVDGEEENNEEEIAAAEKKAKSIRKTHLKYFSKILGQNKEIFVNGVFMSGPRPCWILICGNGSINPVKLEVTEENGYFSLLPSPPPQILGKGKIWVHPMIVDGRIKCFTEFHNINCPYGFLYVNNKNSLRICKLSPDFTYDAPWPTRKIQLSDRVPENLNYHTPSQTFALVTSHPEKYKNPEPESNNKTDNNNNNNNNNNNAANSVSTPNNHDNESINGHEEHKNDETKQEEEEALEEENTGFYSPLTVIYSLELVSPVTWETVDKIDFEEYETVLTVKCLDLECKQTASGKKKFLVIGTGFLKGEDVTTKGKIYVYDIIDVVPEPNNPQTNHKFKRLFVNDEKGPVTNVCASKGYLLAAIGNKVIIHSFEDTEKLSGIAFLDVNMYVNSIKSIKNFILIGDVFKSIWFCAFQEEPAKLVVLGKDFYDLQIYSSEFLIDDNTLFFLVSDADKNICLFTYAPYNVQSSNGEKLLRQADFHVGSHVSCTSRLEKMNVIKRKNSEQNNVKQHCCLCGTLDGGLCYVVPVSERMYKRMNALNVSLTTGISHIAGLNPRGYRQMHSKAIRLKSNIHKNILDGDLLYQFTNLSITGQKDMSKRIGSSVEKIMNDLLEMSMGIEFF